MKLIMCLIFAISMLHSATVIHNPLTIKGKLSNITTEDGFQLPSLTTAEETAVTDLDAGLLLYNSTLGIPRYYTGSAWSNLGFTNPMTTNGDLIIQASGIADRLGIGSTGQVLTVSAGLPSWATPYQDPLTTNGDLLIRSGGSTTRLAIGSASQILTVVGGAPTWSTSGSSTTPIATLLADQVVGAVGDASQIMAGHEFVKDENGTDTALFKFATGALTTDTVGTYTLSDNGTVTEAGGIFGGSAGAADFNGTDQFFTQGTLLDSAGTAIGIMLWIKPDDGQPADINVLVNKDNLTNYNRLQISLQATGKIHFTGWHDNEDAYLASTTVLANGGSQPWTHIAINWDTTNGERLWINGELEDSDGTLTNILNDGTYREFIIGANAVGSAQFYAGAMDDIRIQDKVYTQKDIDMAYASKIDISGAGYATTDYQMWAIAKEGGDDNFPSRVFPEEVLRTTTAIYLYGDQYNAADKLKILGRE